MTVNGKESARELRSRNSRSVVIEAILCQLSGGYGGLIDGAEQH